MKKILVLALAGVMTMAMSNPATATTETVTAEGGSVVIPVGARYSTTVIPSPDDVISLDIYWTDFNFAYSDQTQSRWDADNMWYTTEKINGDWYGDSGIEFTNYSNVALTATASQYSTTGHELNLSQESVDIEPATPGTAGASKGTPGAQILSITGITGDPITEDVDKLAELTLTISKQATS